MRISNTSKIIAVVVAVVIVAAAAFIILNNGGGKEQTEAEKNLSALSSELSDMRSSDAEYPARLLVLGNADMDSDMDSDDVATVRAIIDAGTYDYTEVYFADANYDGLITEEDIAVIEKMIEFEQDVVYYFNVDYKIASFNTSYPLNLGNILTQTLEALCILCPDNIVATDERCYLNSPQGTFYTEYQYVLDYSSLANLGSHKTPNAETYAEIAKENGGYLTVWMNSETAYNTGYLETNLSAYSGIQLVRLPSWENGGTVNGMITAGYLFQRGSGTSWEAAQEYVEWYDPILTEITDRIATLEDSEKKKVIVTYVSNSDTQYSLLAGTSGEHRNLAKLGIIDVAAQYFSDHAITETYYTYFDQEGLASFYQQYGVDLIIGTLGSPFNATADSMISSYDLRSSQIAQLTGTDLVITGWINATGPGELIFMLMIAQYLYPDLFADMDLESVVNEYFAYFSSSSGSWTYDNLNLLYCGEGSSSNIMAA